VNSDIAIPNEATVTHEFSKADAVISSAKEIESMVNFVNRL